MSFREPAPLFRTILENIDRVRRFTAAMDYATFVRDERTTYAVRASLIELAEAAYRLGANAEALCPGIPWREIRQTGNVLRHGYDAIDLERIWHVVVDDLPVLKAGVTETLARIAAPTQG